MMQLRVSVDGPIFLTPESSSMTPAVKGKEYNHKFVAKGGSGKGFKFNATYGHIPAGTSVNDDGTVTGTPDESGVFDFELVVTDSKGNEAKF